MRKRSTILGLGAILGVAMLAVALFAVSPLLAGEQSDSDVFWTFDDPSNPVGTSKLVRKDNGISADFTTSGLPAGQAMTLWFIVFNNPEQCAAGAYQCGPADIGANRPAQGDFLVASGHVIDASGNATFGGSLKVGDTSGSGLLELPDGCIPGYPDCGGPIGLTSPEGALVILAVHSHGPKQTGQVLKSQLQSYTGGCETFIGTVPGGFAASQAEVPDAVGECSTIQVSPHAPNDG